MGKKKLRKKIQNKNCISSVKERKKIRDSILQVFKARLQSPGEGGALLVGQSDEVSPFPVDIIQKKKLQTLHPYSHSNTDTDSSSSDSLMAKRKKVKCKRKTTKKHSSKTLNDPIKKHIKSITEMTSSLPTAGCSGNYSEEKISLITESRVTKCLGLFNQGRKSNKIERVSMCKSLPNKRNENLKRVLNIKSSSDNKDSSEEEEEEEEEEEKENDNCSNMPCKSSSLSLMKSNSQEFPTKENSYENKTTQKISSLKIEHKSQSSAAASCVTVLSNISSEELKENLSENPPIKEIAMEMLSHLRPKQSLFNRDIRQERFNELQRLLLQSLLFPSRGNFAEKIKPAAMISTKRSLLCTTPLQTQDSVETNVNNGIEKDEKSWKISTELNDAKSLLIQNDIRMKVEQTLQQKKLGKFSENSQGMAFKSPFENYENKSSILAMPLLPDGEKCPIDCNQDKMKFIAWKKFFHQTENGTPSIVLDNELEISETQKSIPGFSGDWMDPMESNIKKKQIYQNQDSHDLLEFIEQSRTNETALLPDCCWESKPKIWNKSIFKDDDSAEQSPLWVWMTNLPPSPNKPCLDSIPSPPEKLYPRKL